MQFLLISNFTPSKVLPPELQASSVHAGIQSEVLLTALLTVSILSGVSYVICVYDELLVWYVILLHFFFTFTKTIYKINVDTSVSTHHGNSSGANNLNNSVYFHVHLHFVFNAASVSSLASK